MIKSEKPIVIHYILQKMRIEEAEQIAAILTTNEVYS